MDLFEERGVQPMLLAQRHQPIESSEWLNELKLDGIRCIAYLSAEETDLRNKRNVRLLSGFPELARLHKYVTGTCILDGELIITGTQGKPDFEALQARSMMTDSVRIRLRSRQQPASYAAFDILYLNGEDLTAKPLHIRKEILSEIAHDAGNFAISRVLQGNANALLQLTAEQGLEGIVQKEKSSAYRMGKRSGDWIKVKNVLDEDFLACGYIEKGLQNTSIVLGSIDSPPRYQGHVALGVSREAVKRYPTTYVCPFPSLLAGNENAVWYQNPPVCTVTYMERTSAGSLRQPRFKGFRDDYYVPL